MNRVRCRTRPSCKKQLQVKPVFKRSGGVRGVQHLRPAIRDADGWDVLVGHYLGVDHAGHTADVHSPAMAAKLAQMDREMHEVGTPAARAMPPAPHARGALAGCPGARRGQVLVQSLFDYPLSLVWVLFLHLSLCAKRVLFSHPVSIKVSIGYPVYTSAVVESVAS